LPAGRYLWLAVRRYSAFLRSRALFHRDYLHVLRGLLAVAVVLPAKAQSQAANLRGLAGLMSTNFKSVLAHPEITRGFYRVAIVGAGSLKGKEVAEVLEQRNFPTSEVKLLDDDESLGQLEALKDEVTFIQRVRAEQFEHMDFTFFASDPECTR